MRYICLLLLLFAGFFHVWAGREVIPDNAKVVFYGDSITASGFYPHYLQTYFLTRFPEQKNIWIFSGTSGSNLTNSLLRLEREVIRNRPDVVFIMMGMNDVNIPLYDKVPPPEHNAAQRKAALDAFQASLKETCRRIGSETRIVLLTPTPYDQYSKKSGRNLASANEGLAQAAAAVRAFAAENHLQLVELHAPYTELLKAHPDCGLNRTDRIHPEILGHLCILKLLAESLGLPATVSRIELNYEDGTVQKQENAAVTQLKKEGAVLRWNYSPEALPFPVTAETAAADRLFGFTERVNREEVTVRNLPAGRYDLLAAGRLLGTFSAEELGRGVNIALLDTPSQQLAQRLFLKICEGKKIIGDERTVRAVEFFSQVKANVDPADFQAMEKYNDAAFANQPANSYGRYQYSVYKRFRGRDAELRERAQKCFREAAALAVPAPFEMELRPARERVRPAAGFANGVTSRLTNNGVAEETRGGRKALRFNNDSKKYLSAPLQGDRIVSGVLEFRIDPGPFMPRQNLLEKRSPKNEWHLFLSPSGSRLRPSLIVWNEKGQIKNNVPVDVLLEYGRDYRMDFEIEKSGRLRLRLDGAAILDTDLKEPLNLERSPVRIGGVMRGSIYSVKLYADSLPPQETVQKKTKPAASRSAAPRPVAEFQNGVSANLTNHGAVPVEERGGRKALWFDNDGKRYLSAPLEGKAVVSGAIEFCVAPGEAMPRQNLLEKRSPKNEWHLFLSPIGGNRLRPSLIVWDEKGRILNNVPVNARLEYGRDYRLDFEIEKTGRVRLRLDGTVILDTDLKEPLNLGRSPVRIGGVMRGAVYSVKLFADSTLPR